MVPSGVPMDPVAARHCCDLGRQLQHWNLSLRARLGLAEAALQLGQPTQAEEHLAALAYLQTEQKVQQPRDLFARQLWLQHQLAANSNRAVDALNALDACEQLLALLGEVGLPMISTGPQHPVLLTRAVLDRSRERLRAEEMVKGVPARLASGDFGWVLEALDPLVCRAVRRAVAGRALDLLTARQIARVAGWADRAASKQRDLAPGRSQSHRIRAHLLLVHCLLFPGATDGEGLPKLAHVIRSLVDLVLLGSNRPSPDALVEKDEALLAGRLLGPVYDLIQGACSGPAKKGLAGGVAELAAACLAIFCVSHRNRPPLQPLMRLVGSLTELLCLQEVLRRPGLFSGQLVFVRAATVVLTEVWGRIGVRQGADPVPEGRWRAQLSELARQDGRVQQAPGAEDDQEEQEEDSLAELLLSCSRTLVGLALGCSKDVRGSDLVAGWYRPLQERREEALGHKGSTPSKDRLLADLCVQWWPYMETAVNAAMEKEWDAGTDTVPNLVKALLDAPSKALPYASRGGVAAAIEAELSSWLKPPADLPEAGSQEPEVDLILQVAGCMTSEELNYLPIYRSVSSWQFKVFGSYDTYERLWLQGRAGETGLLDSRPWALPQAKVGPADFGYLAHSDLPWLKLGEQCGDMLWDIRHRAAFELAPEQWVQLPTAWAGQLGRLRLIRDRALSRALRQCDLRTEQGRDRHCMVLEAMHLALHESLSSAVLPPAVERGSLQARQLLEQDLARLGAAVTAMDQEWCLLQYQADVREALGDWPEVLELQEGALRVGLENRGAVLLRPFLALHKARLRLVLDGSQRALGLATRHAFGGQQLPTDRATVLEDLESAFLWANETTG